MLKNETLPLVVMWMNPDGIMLRKISDRETQIPHDFAKKWNLKTKSTNKT